MLKHGPVEGWQAPAAAAPSGKTQPAAKPVAKPVPTAPAAKPQRNVDAPVVAKDFEQAAIEVVKAYCGYFGVEEELLRRVEGVNLQGKREPTAEVVATLGDKAIDNVSDAEFVLNGVKENLVKAATENSHRARPKSPFLPLCASTKKPPLDRLCSTNGSTAPMTRPMDNNSAAPSRLTW